MANVRKQLLVLFLAFCSAKSFASIIVSKPLDFSVPFSGWDSMSNSQQPAEDFSLETAATGNELTWWGRSGVGSYGFDIQFFEDAMGLPDINAFYSFSTPVLEGIFVGDDITITGPVSTSMWSTSIPDVYFPSAGTYWVSIRAYTEGRFVWQHSTGTRSALVFRIANDGAWFTDGRYGSRHNNAFILEGDIDAVPIPGTLLLLSVGLMVLCSRRVLAN